MPVVVVVLWVGTSRAWYAHWRTDPDGLRRSSMSWSGTLSETVADHRLRCPCSPLLAVRVWWVDRLTQSGRLESATWWWWARGGETPLHDAHVEEKILQQNDDDL